MKYRQKTGIITMSVNLTNIEKILLVYKKMDLDPTYLLTGEITSNKMLVEIFKDCPKEKEHILEQILIYLKMLCK